MLTGSPKCAALLSTALLSIAVGSGIAWGWETSVIYEPTYPVRVGEHVSVAVDAATGRTYIAFYEYALGDLWLAREVGSGGNCGPDGSFVCGVLDSNGDVGTYNSIAVFTDAAATRVMVSYHDESGDSLKLVRATYRHDGLPTLLEHDTIQSGFTGINRGLATSLALDSDHRPHIAYQSTLSLGAEVVSHAEYLGDGTGNCGEGSALGDWQCEAVATGEGIGEHISLAFGTTTNPKIAFYDPDVRSPKYASFTGSTWVISTVGFYSEDTGKFVSLYVDDSNRPHMAYFNDTNNTIDYVSLAGAWQYSVIDDAGADCNDVAIVEDASGHPLIVHHNRATADGIVKVARPIAAVPGVSPNCGPGGTTWYCAAVDDPNGGLRHPGKSLAVALRPSAPTGVVIAYSEEVLVEGKLKIACDPPLPLFGDGFELGAPDLWSSVEP